jgi:two-component system sensor histidine kinase UhpB
VLQPVYADDMAADWAEFLDLGLVLALSGLGGAAVIFVVVGRALRPLQEVGEVLPRIGAGDYGARARITGPPELGRLARGVNEMAGRLAAMHDHNRALEDQILRLQDEERAEIARNLHDEIGPQLFAANIDAGMAGSLIAEGRLAEAQTHARAIQSAIGQIQRLVRDILERLRPTPLVELGLMAAIGDLVDFWRARRPEVAFRTELSSSESGLSEATQEAVYRVVQESLSNAIRHGAPRNIVVAVKREAGRLTVNVANDGSAVVAGRTGLGLTGMAERVRNCGGSLQAGPAPDGGWRVVATLVIATEQEHAA